MRLSLAALAGLVTMLLVLAAQADAAPRGPAAPVLGPLSSVALGIADQTTAPFADPRFAALGARRARRTVAWDAFAHDWQVRELDAWLAAARRAGVRPLIAFDRSRIARRKEVVPSRAQLRRTFATFRARYPWVREFSAWNEPNLGGQWPYAARRGAERLGLVWRDMRRACPRCTIAAADLVDYPNMVRFARRIARGAGREPGLWGVHTYLSANRFDASRTLALLRAVRGDLWLTEVGGLVRRRSGSTTRVPEGVGHAARVTSFIFDGLVRLDRRIRRVYLYHWSSGGRRSSWDSGLIDPHGRARPALARVRPARRARAGRRGVHLGAMLGGVRLGMTAAQARRVRPRGVAVTVRRGRVVALRTTRRALRTPAGTGVGSSAGRLRQAHAASCGRRTCVVGVRERGGVVSEFALSRRGRATSLRIAIAG